jgi:Stage II sporulation protein E (SpoIIE)
MNRSVPHSFLFVLLAIAALAAQSLAAQSIVTVPPQQCVWRAGDNPAWAAPDLDEAGWQPYAHWKADPVELQIWIRCHVDAAALRGMAHPAIQVGLYAAYQLYLEGNLLGGSGNLGDGNFSLSSTRSFPVPAQLMQSPRASLALRVTRHRALAIGGPVPGLVTQPLELHSGDADLLDALRARTILRRTSSYADTAACYGVIGVVAIMLLGLFLYDASRREFLLLFIACLSLAILRLNEFCTISQLNYSLDACTLIVSVANLAFTVTQVPFFFALARRRIPLIIWIALFVALLAHGFAGIDAVLGLHGPPWLKEFNVPMVLAVALPAHVLLSLSPFFAFWPYSGVAPRMRPVAALCILWGTADLLWFVVQGTQLVSFPGGLSLFAYWQLSLLQARAFTTAGVLAALLALLFREQRQVTQDRAMLAGEMASAREIQQYLIPEKLPPTPGLLIESVYHPSREVGGDFFQVLPDPRDGSTLIVVGDVAGKGLKAGMLAALIVGSIRTAFQFTADPGTILSLLNERLQGRGLVTCLALRIDRNGNAELANAGHLPPYVNGRLLSLEGALPLGALPSVSFPLQRLLLAEGESMLLLSDGVVEARNAHGELFGFDRTAAISTESAPKIAQAAQAFGQDDDITVLTLTRGPILAPTLPPAPAPLGPIHA